MQPHHANELKINPIIVPLPSAVIIPMFKLGINPESIPTVKKTIEPRNEVKNILLGLLVILSSYKNPTRIPKPVPSEIIQTNQLLFP